MDLKKVGRAVRTLRMHRGWRQEDLGRAVGVSRSVVWRVERGRRPGITIDTLDALAAALGASIDLVLRWEGEGLDRLLDEGHARLVDEVVRRLTALGWVVAVEVSFSRYGERGSIDVMAWHPERRALVVIEVKSVTPDMQAMLSGIDRKARLGPAIARERGWPADVAARVLVTWDTTTNRRRLAAHTAAVRTALPAGSREIVAWLRDPVGPPVAGVWFLPNAQGMSAMGVRRHRVRVGHQGPWDSGLVERNDPRAEPPVRGRPATARTPRVP